MASVRSRPHSRERRKKRKRAAVHSCCCDCVCACRDPLHTSCRTPLFYTRTCLLLLLVGRKRPPSSLGRALLLLHGRLPLLQLDIALVAHALMIAAPRPAGPLLVLGRRDSPRPFAFSHTKPASWLRYRQWREFVKTYRPSGVTARPSVWSCGWWETTSRADDSIVGTADDRRREARCENGCEAAVL